MLSEENVVISTFVNPHLFWITQIFSEERTKTLNSLSKMMENTCKSDINASFEIGEIVAVKLNGKFSRAVVEDIHNAVDEDKCTFMCWLIDYGIMTKESNIYKLPSDGRKTPPLAFQASLNNVAYVNEKLVYNSFGEAIKESNPILNPTFNCRQISMRILSKSHRFQFKCENKYDGILFGDILYNHKNGDVMSFRQYLIEKKVLILEEQLFKELRESINLYKEQHLQLIAQISEQNPCHFTKESPDSICTQIKMKYSQEFEYRDLSGDEGALPLSNRSKGSRSLNSSSELSTSEIESSQNLSTKSKRKLLLEQIKKISKSKQDRIEACSFDTSNSNKEDASVELNTTKSSTPGSKP